MKKILSFILILLISTLLFAQAAKITDANYEVVGAGGINIGKTNINTLEMKYPVDTKTVFATQQEFENYIENYKNKLLSTRLFQDVQMEYKYNLDDKNNIYNVEVSFKLEDSNHLLGLPYPKFSTSDGLDIKLKLKDTNFLGTLNELSADLFYNWKPEYDENGNVQKKGTTNSVGINFGYDYPFKAGIFNSVWNNSLRYSHLFENNKNDLTATTGVSFSYPFEKLSLNFGVSQDITLEQTGIKIDSSTNLKFGENAYFSTPVNIYKFKNYSTLTYNPSVSFSYNWGFNNWKLIKNVKEDITLSFSHSLSNSNISYNDFFRKGYSVSLSNTVSYYLAKGYINPSVSFDLKYYNNFKMLDSNWLSRIGISSRLHAFTAISFPNSNDNTINLANYLRGVVDNTPRASAIVLNLDIPISIVTTSFPLNIINFNMQFSPFIDLALSYNNDSGNLLDFSNAKYCAGLEVLVNPLRFSSYTIRASLGVDLSEARKANSLLRGLWANKEIFIGFGYNF